MNLPTNLWRLYQALARAVTAVPGVRPLLKRADMGKRLDTLLRQAMMARLRSPISVHGLVLHYPRLGLHTIPEMAAGNFEVETRLVMERSLRPGMVMVDLGAHVGYFSLLGARCVGPAGQVYAFEPEPEVFSLLVKNIQTNGYQDVVAPVAKAICNKVGSAALFLGGRDTVEANIYRPLSAGIEPVTVETTTLDDFFAGQRWPPVHLIKMDIQGAEEEALDGMKKVVARNAALKLILDFCPCWIELIGGTPESLFDTLLSLGFRKFAVLKGGVTPVSIPDDVPRLVRMAGDLPLNLLCEQGTNG